MIHRHHRKRRSQGGDDSPANILLLPQELHDWAHANPERAFELGWLVHSYDEPEDVSVAIPKEILKKSRVKKEKEKEKARNRKTISHRVPQDEQEDGAGIYDDLLTECKKELDLATGGKSGDYNALVAVMYDWLSGQAK